MRPHLLTEKRHGLFLPSPKIHEWQTCHYVSSPEGKLLEGSSAITSWTKLKVPILLALQFH
jgi:hypothetical protein